MILALYGEDAHRSRKKLDEIRAKFKRDVDPSGMNAVEFAGSIDPQEVRAALLAAPFLAPRRFVVLKNALENANKERDRAYAELFAQVPKEPIFVVYESVSGEALKGSLAFAAIRQTKFYPEFRSPAPAARAEWIAAEARERGTAFEPAALKAYADTAGGDTVKIANELDALAAYASARGSSITLDAVASLTSVTTEEDAFALLDAIGARNARAVAERFERLLEQGEAEIALLSRIQSHVRSLLLAAELSEEGDLTKDRLARELGAHPFVAGKLLQQVRRFTLEELRAMYGQLIEADRRVKLGILPEARLAVDLFLLRLERV